MPAILFDLDGVLYESDVVIDGAAETVQWFNQHNIPYLFLTNTTSRSRLALVEKLEHLGIQSRIDQYLTPPVAACHWLQQNQLNNISAYVPTVTREEFACFNLMNNVTDKIEAVVIGDLGEQWSFNTLNTIFRQLMNNPDAILIALGMTRYWRANTGLQLDVGPMVSAIEYATGKKAVVTGKPETGFYQAAINLLGNDENIVMIGDDIISDIQASQHAGLKAIQVKTGKFTKADLNRDITPDATLNSVAELPAWWQQHM